DVRVPPPAEHTWIFKIAYQTANSFGATAATIGKLYIVIHRFVVIRSGIMAEEVWSSRVTSVLILAAVIVSAGQCIPLFYCGHTFLNVGGKSILFFDDECVFTNKILSSYIYFAYSA
ncbi:hypothetical protein PMAYCL1PPCAC_26237, partial [Pristionchus mayeri]